MKDRKALIIWVLAGLLLVFSFVAYRFKQMTTPSPSPPPVVPGAPGGQQQIKPQVPPPSPELLSQANPQPPPQPQPQPEAEKQEQTKEEVKERKPLFRQGELSLYEGDTLRVLSFSGNRLVIEKEGKEYSLLLGSCQERQATKPAKPEVKKEKGVAKKESVKEEKTEEKEAKTPDLSKAGIICEGPDCRLVMGGVVYRRGDRLGNYMIEKISIYGVELRDSKGNVRFVEK